MGDVMDEDFCLTSNQAVLGVQPYISRKVFTFLMSSKTKNDFNNNWGLKAGCL
jgi:hypothetical protein